MAWDLALMAPPLAGGLVLGFALGRGTGRTRKRIRELEERAETLLKEQERAAAELEAAKHERQRLQGELDDYRGKVVAHFSGTSEKLRELTLQYRAVYDHFAEGANALCPEGSLGLDARAPYEALPDPEAEAEPEAEPRP